MIIREVINGALRKLGVYASGENASSSEAQDALTQVNRMLSNWSMLPGYLNDFAYDTLTLTSGVSGYSFGSGGDIDTPRPTKILEFSINDGLDYPVKELSRQAYTKITDKAITGRPYSFLYLPYFPLSSFILYPTPDKAYTLRINSNKPLIQYATSSDDFGLPLEYAEAIEWNLTMRLLPEYPGTTTTIAQLIYQTAEKTLNDLKSFHMSMNIPELTTDPINTHIGNYNYKTDNFI